MSVTLDIEQHELRRLRHKRCGFGLIKILRKHEWWLKCTSCSKLAWRVSDIRQGKISELIMIE